MVHADTTTFFSLRALGMGFRAIFIFESAKLVKSKNSDGEDGGYWFDAKRAIQSHPCATTLWWQELHMPATQFLSASADAAAIQGGASTTNGSSSSSSSRGYSKVKAGSGNGDLV